MKLRGGLATALIALIASMVAAAPAGAASTRAEYIAQAEPICLAADQQAERAQKRVLRRLKKKAARVRKKFEARGSVPIEEPSKKELRKLASGLAVFFAKLIAPANLAFDQATAQLRAIPPAPGDEAAVSTWLAGRTEFSRLNYIAIRGGRNGKFKRFFISTLKADEALRKGQAPVNAFGFQHCFVELPDFTIGPPFARLRAITG
jgi:hypothetical protein